ncbi:MAG: hypothetical protein WKG52_00915 [Variovorax sp.]
MKHIALLISTAVCVGFVHAEDVTETFAICARTKDNSARLACYDKLRDRFGKSTTPAASRAAGYQPMELLDLKADIKTLIGKKVAVTGGVQMMGDLAMLKATSTDMTPVWLNIERLSRDDRKKLLSGCVSLLCEGQFSGTIRAGAFGPELVAEQAVIR